MMQLISKAILITVLSSLLLVFQNCGPSGGSSSSNSQSVIEEKATFTWINENIIEPKCVECHYGGLAFGGYLFTSYSDVMESIVPGEPLESPFYLRTFSSTTFEINDEERSIIRTWILLGAPYN